MPLNHRAGVCWCCRAQDDGVRRGGRRAWFLLVLGVLVIVKVFAVKVLAVMILAVMILAVIGAPAALATRTRLWTCHLHLSHEAIAAATARTRDEGEQED